MFISPPGDEEVVCEVADEHAEVVSVVEGQPTEVEDAEQDVSDGGGDGHGHEKVPHFDDIDREQTFSNEILKIIQRSTAPLFWSYY